MSQPLKPRYKLGVFTIVVICILSLSLNVKHVINKFIYHPRINKSDSNSKPVNVFYEIREKEFAVLPVDSNSIVFLGNSLTQNFEITEFFKGLPVKNRGINGDLTSGVLNRLNEITIGKPKKVFIEIGINDLLSSISIDTTNNNIGKIISVIQQRCPNTIIYLQNLLPTNWKRYGTDSLVLPEVIDLNKKLRITCEKYNITYIDLYDSFYENGGLKAEYDCGDHLHLNGQGYIKWKELIEQYVN